MNVEKGLKRLTLFLSILIGVICGGIAIGLLIDKRSSALRHLAKCENEFSRSIPPQDPNERSIYWPKYSSEKYSSLSDYYFHLSMNLMLVRENLPLLYGEEDRKYREEHNIPPDNTKRFYTDEAVEILRTYSKCIEKAGLLWDAHRSFWASLSTIVFIGMLVLAGLGSTLAGFCGVWLIYKLLEWLVIGFRNEKSKDEQKQ